MRRWRMLAIVSLALLATYPPLIIFSELGSTGLLGRFSQTWDSDIVQTYRVEAAFAETLWVVLVLYLTVRLNFSRLDRKLILPSWILFMGMAGGLLAFWLGVWKNFEWTMRDFTFLAGWSYFAQSSVAGFALATIAFLLYRMRSGLCRAVFDTATRFVGPILLTYELILWYLDSGEMGLHVTMTVNWLNVFGFYLLSNWFILGFASILTVMGLLQKFKPPRLAEAAFLLIPLVLLVPLAATTSAYSLTVVSDRQVSDATTTMVLENGTVVAANYYSLTLSDWSCILTKGAAALPPGTEVHVIHYFSLVDHVLRSQVLLGASLTGRSCP